MDPQEKQRLASALRQRIDSLIRESRGHASPDVPGDPCGDCLCASRAWS